jgi:dolichol-phosphate hexosyltransferase
VLLSLVMPVYNEGPTLEAALRRLGEVDMPIPWELVIVDDASTDGAVEQVERSWVPNAKRVVVVRGRRNQGKGAALRKGFSLAEGDILGVHDADLEYDPAEIPVVIEPLLDGRANAVFGTRQFAAHAAFSFWYVVGNQLISLAASGLFDRYITDAYSCYKFFSRDCYEQLRLTADRFEIEAELTGGLLRVADRVFEVPISYVARSREEGKKIRAADGVRGLARLFRVRIRGH